MSRSIFKMTVACGCPGVYSNWLSHAVVQEYFQIYCIIRVSRSIFKMTLALRVSRIIFKLTVTRGCPGVFSNWLSTLVSRSIFKSTVACQCPGVLSNWLSHAGVHEYFKLTVTRGCPGVFSNLLYHAGFQDYFKIDYRMQVSRSIFKLTVARDQQDSRFLRILENFFFTSCSLSRAVSISLSI